MKKSSTGSLLAISASFAAMMIATAAPAYAQDEAQADDAADQPAIIVTGTRRTDRTVADSPVPVDVLSAAAFGLALAGYESASTSTDGLIADLKVSAAVLKASRPTAVNLAWAVDRLMRVVEKMNDERNADTVRAAILTEAQNLADEDVAINRRMAEHGPAQRNSLLMWATDGPSKTPT